MPTVSFKSNATVTEDVGSISVIVERTGDLSKDSAVLVSEQWNDSKTTVSPDDIRYNNAWNDGNSIKYNHDSKFATINFAPGVAERKLVFDIHDDVIDENSERLYLKIISAGNDSIGDDDMYIRIRDNDESIKLKVQNTSGNEGEYIGFTVEAEEPVPHNTLVYLQVQTSTTAGIADGNWWLGGVIATGKKSVTINVKTLSDDQLNDRRIDAKLITYHDDVIITDDTAVGTVRNTTTENPNLPVVSLYGLAPSEIKEGQEGWFTVQSDRVTNGPITVGIEVVSGAGDITVLNDTVTFTPTADKFHDFIKVKPNLDADSTEGNETFTIRLKQSADNSYTLGTANTVTTTILDGAGVEDAPVTTVTESDLSDHIGLITDLNDQVGANTTASIISGSKELSSLGMTMDALGLLFDTIKSAVSWFPGSVPYTEAADLPSLSLTENQIMQGYRLMSWANPEDNPARNVPVNWTAKEAKDTDGLGLNAGDYVDGRLVLDELPVFWPEIAERDGYIGTRSIQGRESSTTFSHKKDFANSLDISPVFGQPMYVVAPASGDIIFSQNTATIAQNNAGLSGLGNVATLKLDQTTATGKPIYMTFAHMETGSIMVSAGQSVVAGQVLGKVGDTGGYIHPETGKWTQYEKHFHVQVGTELRNKGSHPSNNKIVDGNGINNEEKVPPVYFSTFQQDERVTVHGGVDQDLGFPIGGREPLITGINPTFTKEEFYAINSTISAVDNPSINTGGGTGGDFPTPDPVWNGTAAAETNEYWEGKVSNVNEFVDAGAGYDFILGSGGNDVINGEADGGQVNLFGPGAIRANFAVTTLSDGGYQVYSIDGSFGTDRYYNIDGIWFGGHGNIPGAWYNMADLVINTFVDGDGALPSVTDPYDELFNGTAGNDIIGGGTGIDWFTATSGDDIFYGGNGRDDDQSWNQVNFTTTPFAEMTWGYDIASDLLFSRHQDLGLDVYDHDITDFWFADGGWHGRAELIGLASDTFVFG